jgi:hypothetical protein
MVLETTIQNDLLKKLAKAVAGELKAPHKRTPAKSKKKKKRK